MLLRLAFLACCFYTLQAQQLINTDSLGPVHFRGLCLSSKRVVWLSGTKGSVFRSTNAGKSWKAISVSAFPRHDFRDIHAWNRRKAIAMSSGDSAVIVRTQNGGKTWTTVYANNNEGVFLDGLDAKGRQGVCLGDPMPLSFDSSTPRFLLLLTDDAGQTWKEFWPDLKVQQGEAAFAASGTSVQYLPGKRQDGIIWVTGGGATVRMPEAVRSSPDVIHSWCNINVPMRGGAGWGAYTMTLEQKHGVILGGNYKEYRRNDSIAAWFNPESRHFEPAQAAPRGYRSGSCFNKQHQWYFCTGTNGTDFSTDYGAHWQPFSNESGNACISARNTLWVAGNKGKVYCYRLR